MTKEGLNWTVKNFRGAAVSSGIYPPKSEIEVGFKCPFFPFLGKILFRV